MKRVLLALFLVVVACSGDNVTLATLGGADSGTPTRCTNPTDCPSGTFCERAACGDVAGTCQLLPPTCASDEKSVCGCDGITYFNDCLRRLNGVTSSSPGMCMLQNAVTCGGPQQTPCPSDTYCWRFFGGKTCPPDVLGSCWVVPDVCPAPGPYRFDLCGGGAECRGLCDAVKGGGVYHKAGPCP